MMVGTIRHGASPSRRVVIVGPSDDCRDVLEAALARRGLATFSAGEARAGLRLIREHAPDVIVLDGESRYADDAQVQAELETQLERGHAALIVLGRMRGRSLVPRQTMAKPYHFAPLVHTIEKLAAARAA